MNLRSFHGIINGLHEIIGIFDALISQIGGFAVFVLGIDMLGAGFFEVFLLGRLISEGI